MTSATSGSPVLRSPAAGRGGPGGTWAGSMPALSWRGHLWRVAVATVLGLGSVTLLFAELPDPDHLPPRLAMLFLGDLVILGPASLVLLLLHRRFPLTVAVTTTLLSAVSAVAAVPALVCLASVATRRRPREIVPLAVLSAGAGAVFGTLYPEKDPLSWWAVLAGIAVIIAGVVAWGLYLGTRRELIESWRLRAEDSDRAQQVAAERARESERARIAREMHDVLAHRLSLVSMHAGVLAFRTDLPAEEARSEARVIQDTARQALEELRGVLGLLRQSDAGQPPQPTIADLDDLVSQARTAGPVGLESCLDAVPPAPLGRHVYRVVQEGLTNARRHAPGAAVTVRIAGAPGSHVEVEVQNARPPAGPRTPPHPGAGLGLIGLSERAALVGGTFEAAPTPQGGFALRARIPWPQKEGDV